MGANGAGAVDAVVFDFDGTLAELHLDFSEMERRLTERALSLFPLIPDPSNMRALEWVESLARALPEEEASVFRRDARALIVEMEMDAARRGKLFSFTKGMLLDLTRRGVRTAVITRNCDAAVKTVFPDIESYCGAFLSRDHVPRVKPDPDHLLRALERVGVAPGRALMVGDHPVDVRTGKSAGTFTAGVWSGNSTMADLVKSGADRVAPDCGTLLERLRTEGMIR